MTKHEAAPEPKRVKDSVLIVAGAWDPPHIRAAPLQLATTHEVWGFNHLGLGYEPDTWDRYFELHTQDQWVQAADERLPLLQAVAEAGAAVYLTDPDLQVHPAVQFPTEWVARQFKRGGYHASTLDWLVALALAMGFSTICISNLGGMDLEAGECRSARACLEYWLGLAEGRGCTVHVNDGTEVLRTVERGGGMYPMDPLNDAYLPDQLFRRFYRDMLATVDTLATYRSDQLFRRWMADGDA